ncbi:MAG: preprotein translocase subunit SecE [Solirubrobacteraceae bacterium]|nr:preprotein translocase subunit SecE [Solirubrobacteraceae bacterium]
MARNEDEARKRRAKRNAENPQADDAADALTPAADDADTGEPALVGETLRAETESHAGVSGTPVGLGEPTSEDAPHSDLEPAQGGVVAGGEVTTSGGGPRVFKFFKASWAELQRVRWPDRQQVAQGTAVTLGFVVIAGAFLGVADLVARQIVNLIL